MKNKQDHGLFHTKPATERNKTLSANVRWNIFLRVSTLIDAHKHEVLPQQANLISNGTYKMMFARAWVQVSATGQPQLRSKLTYEKPLSHNIQPPDSVLRGSLRAQSACSRAYIGSSIPNHYLITFQGSILVPVRLSSFFFPFFNKIKTLCTSVSVFSIQIQTDNPNHQPSIWRRPVKKNKTLSISDRFLLKPTRENSIYIYIS